MIIRRSQLQIRKDMIKTNKVVRVACVIVTYNRLPLLKECVEAVTNQTYSLHKIIIIDNHSTDNTLSYLQTLIGDNRIEVVSLSKNIGGAGGFSYGIKQAAKSGVDWIWAMDDDTIPYNTALEKLVEATSLTANVGFLCSKVLWTDGSPHYMNKPGVCLEKGSKLFNHYSSEKTPAFLCMHSSLVSLMINTKAVREVGLPIEEFFIWGDDIEYTMRISSRGYDCFYVDNSVVLHKTASNYAPYADTAPAETAWKFYYHARNMSFLKRKLKHKTGIALLISTLNMYRNYLRRISKRKDNKVAFRRAVLKGCWDGLTFNPQVKYLD